MQQGWECPKCGAVLAPWVQECPHCVKGTITIKPAPAETGAPQPEPPWEITCTSCWPQA